MFWRALGYIRPQWRVAATIVLVLLLSALIVAIQPLLVRVIVDDAIPARDTRLLTLLFAATVAVVIVNGGLTVLYSWLASALGESITMQLRQQLFARLQAMPLAFFTHTQLGTVQSRFNADISGIRDAVTGLSATITANLLNSVITVAILVTFNWRLALVVLLLPVLLVPTLAITPLRREWTAEQLSRVGRMNGYLTDSLNTSAVLLIRLLGTGVATQAAFDSRAAAVRSAAVRLALLNSGVRTALVVFGMVASAVVYFVGGLEAATGALTIGTVIATVVYVQRLYAPLASLSMIPGSLMAAMVGAERVWEILDWHATATRTVLTADVAPRLIVRDACYRYPGRTEVVPPSLLAAQPTRADDMDTWVLRGVDFEVAKGEVVAVVGPSGAGKTTLAMAVAGILPLSRGEVTVGGSGSANGTGPADPPRVSLVTQEPYLFHDTVRANLLLAKPTATADEVIAVCQRARLAETIARLPDGLDTIVGERGHRLSGGEKQRVAIARALLSDPSVIVLDEATAHVDSEAEASIWAALAELMRDRASIVIGHRLSTILAADQVLVLDDGRIVERGRHDDLMAAGGVYRRLFENQVVPVPR